MTSVLDRPAPAPDLTVPYGAQPEQVIDLRFPPLDQRQAAKVPLIVLVHGGFWRPAYDRRHLGPMADALAAAGYMVAVPEYRRAGMAEEGWTGPFNDIAAALDRIGDIAAPHGADIGRITWAGHSAHSRNELHPASDTTCAAGQRLQGPGHGDPAGNPGRAAAQSTR